MSESAGSRPDRLADRLSPEEIEALLYAEGTATLGLAADGRAYTVPVSFGYDGDALYFQLSASADSQKTAYIQQTEQASATVRSFDGANRWDSVSVVGRLERVPGCELDGALAAMADNAALAELGVFADVEDLSFVVMRLVPARMSGRRAQTELE